MSKNENNDTQEQKPEDKNKINEVNPPKVEPPKNSPPSTLDNTQDTQNTEQAELSEIETGGKGQPDFEEMMNFTHTYTNYRKAKVFLDKSSLESHTFELIMTNVFILSGQLINIKSFVSPVSNKEAIKNTRQKINAYKTQSMSDKITFVDNIPYYVKIIGYQETIESILPIINELPKEKEKLSDTFFKNFPKFVDAVNKFGDKSYFILKEYMTKLISEYLTNNNAIYKSNIDLVNSISDGLVYMTQFIKDEDKGECILTIVIKMAQDDFEERKREVAMRLFGELTPYLQSDLINLYIIPQVNSFSDDHCVNVRKEAAKQLYKISEKVGKETFKRRLLPVYKQLAKDTLWNVKKSAVEILPKITNLCSIDIISKDLIPIFKSFSQDENANVKNAAVEVFGEFISLIDKNEANNFLELLNFYVETIKKLQKGKKEAQVIIEKCAFNFPAVLLFFGKNHWEKLKECYNIMANEKEEKIKLPLASCLGEISNIIGSDATESDLCEYVDMFFKRAPNNSELKMKILKVLPVIIKNINSNKKNTYLDFLKYMIGNKGDKWRKRVQYCKIIGKFNGTYSDNIIYKRVFPIAINFCFDDISQVRTCAAKHNSRLILQLISSKSDFKNKTLIIIKSFAQCINYKYRQLFIYMCKHLFENEEVFNENISELLIDLAYDQVPNVKIVLARFLVNLLKKEKYANLAKNETIRKIVKILKNDKNPEIIQLIEKIKNVEDIEVELNKQVNYKFKDNMNFVSNEFGITRNVPLHSGFQTDKFPEKIEQGIEMKDIKEEDKKEEEKKEEQPKEGETIETDITKKEVTTTENKVEEKNVEENKVEEKIVEEKKVEENKVEENKVEENKVEENKVEENKVEEKKEEENKVEEKKEEENKVEEKKEEEKKIEEAPTEKKEEVSGEKKEEENNK